MALISLLVLQGCKPSKRRPMAADRPAVATFKDGIARDGSITFHNFGGQFIQMDGDVDIRFFAEKPRVLHPNACARKSRN